MVIALARFGATRYNPNRSSPSAYPIHRRRTGFTVAPQPRLAAGHCRRFPLSLAVFFRYPTYAQNEDYEDVALVVDVLQKVRQSYVDRSRPQAHGASSSRT